MITFWVNAAGSFGMELYIERRAPDLAERIQVRTYESLTADLEVTHGAHIFSALDQLSPGQREAIATLHDRLAELHPRIRLLNNPRHVLRRYDLLATMFAAGINGFRAYRAAEVPDSARFPVFVREESGHTGALTGLVGNRRELVRALFALRAAGHRIADLLVVEFCDLSDSDGIYRMATAYKIGEHIVPAFLLKGRRWVLKWTVSDHDERAMREYRDHLLGNPHEAWLRRIFALAVVDYGRIDFGVRGETRQVWEINLNPTPGPSRGPPVPPLSPKLEAMLQENRRVYFRGMQEAFRALDPGMDQTRAAIRLDPASIARLRAESARAARRQAALAFLHRVYRHPTLGWLLRAARSRFLPRA
jgi:hypothetical protein